MAETSFSRAYGNPHNSKTKARKNIVWAPDPKRRPIRFPQPRSKDRKTSR